MLVTSYHLENDLFEWVCMPLCDDVYSLKEVALILYQRINEYMIYIYWLLIDEYKDY